MSNRVARELMTILYADPNNNGIAKKNTLSTTAKKDNQILKNGKLKLPLSLPADVVLESNDLRDVIQGNWKAIPVLMFIHPVDVRDEDGNAILTDEESASES